jgi:hypothetical protein
LRGGLGKAKVYVSADATAFLLSKGARVDDELVRQFEHTADSRAGGYRKYKGNKFVYEDAGSLLNIALMKRKLEENPNAIHDRDSDGYTPLDRAVRSRLTVDKKTRFYAALVETRDIFEAAKVVRIDLSKFLLKSAQQKSEAELSNSDLKPSYLKKWQGIIEAGNYPKTYKRGQGLQVHAGYVKFLLDQGAEVTTETYKLIRGCSFVRPRPDNYREGFFNVIDSENGKLIRTSASLALRHKYEAARSAELMERDVLPTDMSKESWAFKHMGITLGEQVQGEPLFSHATLPEGWTKEISKEDPREIYLLCPEGRRKATIWFNPNPDWQFAQLRLYRDRKIN